MIALILLGVLVFLLSWVCIELLDIRYRHNEIKGLLKKILEKEK
ncbi:MAG: hypothetical protein WC975_11720 [Phycisphaerae bacterium]